jgi:large subunit ribosomal protein L25
MAETHGLKGAARTNFGKGAARKLRAAGHVPAVVYGHGEAPRHVALPAHELTLLVRHKNVIIDLDVDGKNELVLVKDVQKDHVRQIIEHVDLVIVKKGETVVVDIPVVIVGHSFPGTVAMVEHSTLTVEAEALHIPEHIEIDVTDMHEHTHVSAKDIKLPNGVTLHLDPETIVVAVQQAARAASVEHEPEHVAEAAAAKAHADEAAAE